MAKRKNKTKKSESSTLLDAILAGITQHWHNHGEEFLKTVAESKDEKGIINFGALIDQSTADTSIEVKVRFSATVTDKLDFSVIDATQGRFEVMDKAGKDEESEGPGAQEDDE